MKSFFEPYGVPRKLHSDNSRELTTQTQWQWISEKKSGMRTTKIDKFSPWQNAVEQGVVMLKQGVLQLISKTNAPPEWWEWDLKF